MKIKFVISVCLYTAFFCLAVYNLQAQAEVVRLDSFVSITFPGHPEIPAAGRDNALNYKDSIGAYSIKCVPIKNSPEESELPKLYEHFKNVLFAGNGVKNASITDKDVMGLKAKEIAMEIQYPNKPLVKVKGILLTFNKKIYYYSFISADTSTRAISSGDTFLQSLKLTPDLQYQQFVTSTEHGMDLSHSLAYYGAHFFVFGSIALIIYLLFIRRPKKKF